MKSVVLKREAVKQASEVTLDQFGLEKDEDINDQNSLLGLKTL